MVGYRFTQYKQAGSLRRLEDQCHLLSRFWSFRNRQQIVILSASEGPAVPCICKKKQVLRPPWRTQNDNSFGSFNPVQNLKTPKASDIGLEDQALPVATGRSLIFIAVGLLWFLAVFAAFGQTVSPTPPVAKRHTAAASTTHPAPAPPATRHGAPPVVGKGQQVMVSRPIMAQGAAAPRASSSRGAAKALTYSSAQNQQVKSGTLMIASPAPAKPAFTTMSPMAASAPDDQRLLPSVPQRYQHFLLLQNHLETAAEARENKGQDGDWLRNYYKNSLGLSDADFEALRESGRRLESALKDNDVQVNALRRPAPSSSSSAASSYAPNSQSGGSAKSLGVEEFNARLKALPPPSPEMVQLQQEREAAIEGEIATLKASLSPEGAAKIVDFVENHFVRSPATVTPFHSAASPQPASQEAGQ